MGVTETVPRPPEAGTYREEWVQIQFPEHSDVQEIYGFSSSKGLITVEGVRYLPERPVGNTLLIFMHPAATQTVLKVPKAMAMAGLPVLVAGSRYTRNDTSLIMENVLRDLGSYVYHAREVWGYERTVLAGWSGGGSLAMFYQAQAERPTITTTPAGDPVDVAGFRLVPADGLIFHAAHISRASLLRDMIDPSVVTESTPHIRDRDLDLYDPANPHRPPYDLRYLERFREAQHSRIARRTAWVHEVLATLRKRGGAETERGFVTHRTMADPRFLDPAIDPSDRVPGVTFMGDPEKVNSAPSGFARFSTLRSWLSQWSPTDTNVDAERNAGNVTVPLLAIRNTADDAVLGPQVERVHEAAASRSKQLTTIVGANHYYGDQPNLLQEAVDVYRSWMDESQLL